MRIKGLNKHSTVFFGLAVLCHTLLVACGSQDGFTPIDSIEHVEDGQAFTAEEMEKKAKAAAIPAQTVRSEAQSRQVIPQFISTKRQNKSEILKVADDKEVTIHYGNLSTTDHSLTKQIDAKDGSESIELKGTLVFEGQDSRAFVLKSQKLNAQSQSLTDLIELDKVREVLTFTNPEFPTLSAKAFCLTGQTHLCDQYRIEFYYVNNNTVWNSQYWYTVEVVSDEEPVPAEDEIAISDDVEPLIETPVVVGTSVTPENSAAAEAADKKLEDKRIAPKMPEQTPTQPTLGEGKKPVVTAATAEQDEDADELSDDQDILSEPDVEQDTAAPHYFVGSAVNDVIELFNGRAAEPVKPKVRSEAAPVSSPIVEKPEVAAKPTTQAVQEKPAKSDPRSRTQGPEAAMSSHPVFKINVDEKGRVSSTVQPKDKSSPAKTSTPAAQPKVEVSKPLVSATLPRPTTTPAVPVAISSDRPPALPSQLSNLPKAAHSTNTVYNQAIRKHNDGLLRNAVNMLEVSNAFSTGLSPIRIVPLQSKRYFTTLDMKDLILQMGQWVKQMMPGRVLAVNTLSARTGGKNLLGYETDRKKNYILDAKGRKKPIYQKSHQNGLDMDLSYLVKDRNMELQPIVTCKRNGKVVKCDKPDSYTHERILNKAEFMAKEQWQLIKKTFATGKIQIMFMDSAIKRGLCEEAIASGDLKKDEPGQFAFEIFRRLRPLEKHHNHLHVRVSCSSLHPDCAAIDLTHPQTSGCFSKVPARLAGAAK